MARHAARHGLPLGGRGNADAWCFGSPSRRLQQGIWIRGSTLLPEAGLPLRMRHRVDNHSVALQLVHDAVRELPQRTASDGVIVRLVMVRGFSKCTQGFGHSALKLVGKPLVTFEQIEVRLARVVYGPWQDLDLVAGHGGSGLGEHLRECLFDRNGLDPTHLPLCSATKRLL